ncbi:nuclear transport factor 2 family protein [Oryzobacter telluris]|jgi:ketosteroid isomerase-like protein|uniref:nuclear transport factor 2 family protein n=1 Tax=Oryzobacter telluris TaxID=3149179 RepID=UPI00370D78C8
MVQEASDPVTLVTGYLAAAQQARTSRDAQDFEAVRAYFHPDATIQLAAAWGHDPWRVVHRSADEILERLRAPINTATSLTTEDVNVVLAGEDVLVEQRSTLHHDGRDLVSMVCHLFTVRDGRISGIRAYRNDLGLPQG